MTLRGFGRPLAEYQRGEPIHSKDGRGRSGFATGLLCRDADGRPVVVWRTPVMAAHAFTYFADLAHAWVFYRRLRNAALWVSPGLDALRCQMLEREAAALGYTLTPCPPSGDTGPGVKKSRRA